MLMIIGLCAIVSLLLGLITHSAVLGVSVFFGSVAWLIFDNFFGKGGGV